MAACTTPIESTAATVKVDSASAALAINSATRIARRSVPRARFFGGENPLSRNVRDAVSKRISCVMAACFATEAGAREAAVRQSR